MKKVIPAFGLLLTLAACSTDGPLPPEQSRSLPPKMSLDVQTINLADRSLLQPAGSPYNANHFSPTIGEAIKRWAGDRLQAAGQSGRAIVVIKEASLTAQSIPTQSGMDSWFKRQQAIKYVGHAEVTVEANGREGYATTDATATRAVTLPENPTDIEKQQAYYTLLNGLMKDLGVNLDTAIQTHMANFIINAPILGSTAVPTSAPITAAPTDSALAPIAAPVSAAPFDQSMSDSPLPASSLAPLPPPTTVAPTPGVIPLSGPGGM